MDIEVYIDMLLDSLDKKINILNKIKQLNIEQGNIVSKKITDEAAFDRNLKEKGELVDQIVIIDEGFDSVFSKIKDNMTADKEKYALKIKALQEKIKIVTDIGTSVKAQELRNKIMVENCFLRMRREISNAKNTTSKANLYYKNANKLDASQSHFLDQKK